MGTVLWRREHGAVDTLLSGLLAHPAILQVKERAAPG
ncbi:hypothetical protein DESC_480194 [Desulfosarcina cetonica]|nr:hypothetical protein DESC_480194 [Desulfosarcina cetonica]